MKPLQGGPATAIRIPVVLCGAPSVKTKTLSTKKKGPGCSTDRGLTESSGEVFSLDILSHRMSVIACYQEMSLKCMKATNETAPKRRKSDPITATALAYTTGIIPNIFAATPTARKNLTMRNMP